MADPITGPAVSVAAHNLLDSGAVVALAARLLRDKWEQVSDQERVQLLDRLAHRADDLLADLTHLVRTGEPHIADQDRLAGLETAAAALRDRIEMVEAAALDSEAAALVSDARILELAAEVESLRAARDAADVIDQARAVVMSALHIGEDAALAVLAAVSQRENISLHAVAHRIAVPQDESSDN